MPIREIKYSSHFKRSLKKLDPPLQQKVRERLKLFLEHPFNPQLKTHKLAGRMKNYWSFSVTDNYRIMFEFLDKNSIGLIDIGTHDVYR